MKHSKLVSQQCVSQQLTAQVLSRICDNQEIMQQVASTPVYDNCPQRLKNNDNSYEFIKHTTWDINI